MLPKINAMASLRLDKFLTSTTDLTRSLAAKAIKQKRVSVNGELAKSAAQKVTPEDNIRLDNEPLLLELGFRYYLLNKPAGFVCANSDSLHPLVFDLLTEEINKQQLHTVGRLDLDTTGLLLITDNGQFSHHLTSPRRKVAKVYRAWLAEPLITEAEEQLAKGIILDDDPKPTLPASLERISEREVLITVYEGRYHQVKRMFAALGNAVEKLHREQLGALKLDEQALPQGKYRPLKTAEVELLLASTT